MRRPAAAVLNPSGFGNDDDIARSRGRPTVTQPLEDLVVGGVAAQEVGPGDRGEHAFVLQGQRLNALLHGFQIQAALADKRTVQEELVVGVIEHPLAFTIRGSEVRLGVVDEVARLPVINRDSGVLRQGWNGCGAVVGGQPAHPLPSSDSLVQRPEKPGELLIEANVGVHGFPGVHAELVSHVIRGGKAHSEEVGVGTASQFFAGDGRYGEIHDQGVSNRCAFEDVKAAVGLAEFLEVIGVGGVVVAFEWPFVRRVVLGLNGQCRL